QRGHRRWSVKRMYTSAPGPYDLPSCRVDRARHGPRARRHPLVLARGWPDPSRPGSGTTTPASDSRTRRPRTLAPAPAVGSEDGRALRVLGPLGGRFPHADVEDRVPHGLGEAALQLVEEVARLVLRTRLDVRERREVVEVLVVQALGELAQVVLDLDEVERETVLVELVPGERELHDVAVPVQALALPLVVPQEVGAVVVGLNADDVHAAPSGAVQGDHADVHLGRPRDRVDDGVGDGAGVQHAVAGREPGVPLPVDRIPQTGGGRRRLDQGRAYTRAPQL